MPRLLRYAFLCLFAVMLSACGGGGADSSAVDTPASIEITPNAVILTQMGQQKALSVRVLDAQGRDITASVGAPQWESSHPEQISVSGAGVISASGAGGSGQITARLGELRSAPLLAVHTLVPLGAVLLTDAQIVGEPEESTPGAAPSFANTYRVRLTGLAAPQVGELLINTESKVVAGRVRAVQSADGVHVVTLGLVSVREMFPRLAINEVIELSRAEVIIPAAVTAQFDVVRKGSSFTFTPKVPGADLPLLHVQAASAQRLLSKNGTPTPVQARVAQAVGTSASGPVGKCKLAVVGASGAGSLPISVLPTQPFSVDINPSLEVLSTPENGLERLVLHTEPTISAGLEFKVLVAFEGKVTCDLELFVFRLPVGGPLGLILGGLVPVGIGAELGGKFTFADMALGARMSVKTTVDAGIAFPPGQSSTMVAETGPLTTTLTPTLNGPSLADFRFEPSLTVYGFAKASFGSAILSSLRFDALAVQAGLALKGNFAPRSVQMADTAYKSDYQLAGIIKAGFDTQFNGFLNRLGLAGIAETALLDKSFPLATSPAGTVSADVASFVTGDTVNFKVKLDPASRTFLGINNVAEVILVRNDLSQQEVARANVAADQTEVNFAFIAPNAGSASEFFAFVLPRVLHTDLLALELGQAQAQAQAQATNTRVTAQLPAQISAPTPLTVFVEVQTGNGQFAPAPNMLVEFTPTCATVNPTSGRTDASGVLSTTVTPNVGCSSVSVDAVARADVGTTPLAQTTVNATVAGSVIKLAGQVTRLATFLNTESGATTDNLTSLFVKVTHSLDGNTFTVSEVTGTWTKVHRSPGQCGGLMDSLSANLIRGEIVNNFTSLFSSTLPETTPNGSTNPSPPFLGVVGPATETRTGNVLISFNPLICQDVSEPPKQIGEVSAPLLAFKVIRLQDGSITALDFNLPAIQTSGPTTSTISITGRLELVP